LVPYISLKASCCSEPIVTRTQKGLTTANCANSDAMFTFSWIWCFSQRTTKFYWIVKGKIIITM